MNKIFHRVLSCLQIAVARPEEISMQGVIQYLKTIDYINDGGCLIAAYAFYLSLKKQKLPSDKFGLVSLNKNRDDMTIRFHKNNMKYVSDPTKNDPDLANHFGWTFDNKHRIMDITGVIPEFRYPLIVLIPNNLIDDFFHRAIRKSGWNFLFDRQTYVPEIEKVLGINLGIGDIL